MRYSLRFGIFLLIASVSLAGLGTPNSAGTPLLQSGAESLELLGHTDLEGAQYGDIWVHGQFAYIGGYSAGTGVQVVDVSDPANPERIGTLRTSSRSSHEDVAVVRANTAAFQGDLLATGVQPRTDGGARGVQFWDVTNPRDPVRLGFFETGQATSGVHELYMFVRDNRVFALLAVPNSEVRGAGGDFRIVEATDPRNPRQIADWGVRDALGTAPTGRGGSSFCHSAWANESGTVAYLSYWDHGVIILDITNPNRPRFLGQTTYESGEEGNAHSVWPIHNGNMLVAADEDFSVLGGFVEITEPASLARRIQGGEWTFTKRICAAGETSAEVVYVGSKGCKQNKYLADPQGKIAMFENKGCDIRTKIREAQEAGAIGFIMSQKSPSQVQVTANEPVYDIPGIIIPKAEADVIKDALTAGQTVRVRIATDSRSSVWGFLRIFDISNPARPVQVSTFATEHALDCTPPTSDGWYTVHNPFVVGNRAYLSWYADGLRVLDISDPANPREVASFIPADHHEGDEETVEPRHDDSQQTATTAVWGVYVQGDLVYLSDVNDGLYILRHRR